MPISVECTLHPGDVIVAHLTVRYVSRPCEAYVCVDRGNYGDSSQMMLSREFVIGIVHSPLRIGDSVLVNGDDTSTPKVVRAVFENYVWISNPAGQEFRTVPANLLERVPPSGNNSDI